MGNSLKISSMGLLNVISVSSSRLCGNATKWRNLVDWQSVKPRQSIINRVRSITGRCPYIIGNAINKIAIQSRSCTGLVQYILVSLGSESMPTFESTFHSNIRVVNVIQFMAGLSAVELEIAFVFHFERFKTDGEICDRDVTAAKRH